MLGYSLLGVFIWMLASVGFRTWGHFFLHAHNDFIRAVFFIALFAILPLGGLFRMFISPTAKMPFPMICIAMVVPGLVMDVFVVLFYGTFFPNLHPSTLPMFVAWMLLAYALMLLNGLIYKR